MTPDRFVAKWTGVTLQERSAAQEHFHLIAAGHSH